MTNPKPLLVIKTCVAQFVLIILHFKRVLSTSFFCSVDTFGFSIDNFQEEMRKPYRELKLVTRLFAYLLRRYVMSVAFLNIECGIKYAAFVYRMAAWFAQ